jgi:hypothetical protein
MQKNLKVTRCPCEHLEQKLGHGLRQIDISRLTGAEMRFSRRIEGETKRERI